MGCTIKGKTVNIIIYADDIVVFGPTRHAVEEILGVLTRELKEKGLEVNKNKTVVMDINMEGKVKEIKNITIENHEIEWAEEF